MRQIMLDPLDEKSQKFSVKFNHMAIWHYQNIYTLRVVDSYSMNFKSDGAS